MHNKLQEIILSIQEINNDILDISSWKTFTMEELFLIKGSKTTPKNILQSYGKGIYPYITTKATNNGVDDFFNFYTEKGNCLTIDSAVLGSCFYQELNFSASDHVELAIPYYENFNKYHGLFFQTIINKTNQNIYNYSHKYNQKRIKETVLLLPSTTDSNNKNIPNWNYIENIIKNITLNLNTNNINHIFSNLSAIQLKDNDTSSWKLFKISDYFNVECSKYHNPDNYKSGKIPYVARTTFNNGVVCFVDTSEKLYDGNCIIIGAESAQAFYQEKPFITGNKVYRIYETNKSKLNKEIALFLCTLLNKEGKKYSYANAWVSEKVKETEIYLPAITNPDGTFSPDWNYMENYIKNLNDEIFK